MKRLALTFAIALAAAACLPAAAGASFGLNNFDVAFTIADGTPATQAGSHPFAMTTSLGVNFTGTGAEAVTEGHLRDVVFEQVAGLAGDTTAYPRCSTLDFLTPGEAGPSCPMDSVVGITANSFGEPGGWSTSPVFNLAPPAGTLLRLGFLVVGSVRVVVDVGLKHTPPYNPTGAARNLVESLYVYGNVTQLWGNPSDSRHDDLRGQCGLEGAKLAPGDVKGFEFENESGETCPVEPRSKPFLTLPTSCAAPGLSSYEALSWEGDKDAGSALTHDVGGNPTPFSGCGLLGFKPSIAAKPTTRAAQSPSGLDLSLDVEDTGLTSVGGRAQSDIRKVVLTLPKGMTANPSLAEGLEVCSEADLERETLGSAPGEGCPEASKIGTVEVESPLIEEPIDGALYVAKPYENEFHSLLALYFVLKNPKLGVIVKQAARVEPDPETGQLIGITEDIPQLPFSHFRLHFREGGRSPLVSPPLCGSYEAKAELTPWSGGPAVTATSAFTIVSGPGEGPCPPGGTAPFHPGFEAGSINNNAGSYSPFYMRLTRKDGEQDMTRFSAKLPPGVVAKLAGVSKCSDAQIARAKAKTGLQERAAPSCPQSSEIGHVRGGAGVGSQLTYVPGELYMAGPYHGAPLSVVAIVPAVAGPFDVGNVVVRQALRIDPRSAEVTADGAASDPLPHILAGIPLNVRYIRVLVDRPGFTLNPTSCEESAVGAQLWGGGADVFSSLDDTPVALDARYQAASCSHLGFKPRLALKLKGGTKRGNHPKLRGVFRPRPGDANLSKLVLRLPRSAFLDQAHIRTICTRVQFAAAGGNGAGCPKGAVYGHARAFTPLLDEPLEGPVFLRSSNHNLPDFVAALHGLIDVEAVARIDSKQGGIRATFTDVPDAPLSKVIVNMQGGHKGLIVNSTDLCRSKHRADAQMLGHNGKRATVEPEVQASCARHTKHRRKHR